jgi:hypothetical protein
VRCKVSTTQPMHSLELARLAGVSKDTLRYYERLRLLPPAPRSAAGYRLFPAQALGRLRSMRSQWLHPRVEQFQGIRLCPTLKVFFCSYHRAMGELCLLEAGGIDSYPHHPSEAMNLVNQSAMSLTIDRRGPNRPGFASRLVSMLKVP